MSCILRFKVFEFYPRENFWKSTHLNLESVPFMTHRIIVLGIMRSGTSLTADLIRHWGAYAGAEDDLWKAGDNDPRDYGYMEYKPLQDINDELLGGNDTVPVPNEVLEEKAADPAFRKKALDLLEDMDAQAARQRSAAWVWKDARVCLTLPFWEKIWGDPVFVITVRHPVEVALSVAKTENFNSHTLPYFAGFVYWQYCMLNVLLFTQRSNRKLFIAYDQLVQSPQSECARLNRFLDQQCEMAAAGSQTRLAAMLPYVAQSQRHYHAGKSLAEMKQATKELRALYNFLRVKIAYPEEAFSKEDFALYPGWREYLQTMNAIMELNSEA
jgi:hypothetical protein